VKKHQKKRPGRAAIMTTPRRENLARTVLKDKDPGAKTLLKYATFSPTKTMA
jgi:hypothetical protein